jgi:hypothetical protein
MKIYDVVLGVIRALVLVELIREVASLIYGGIGLAIFGSVNSTHIPITGNAALMLIIGVLDLLGPIAISLFIFAISRRLAHLIVRITTPGVYATQSETVAPGRV